MTINHNNSASLTSTVVSTSVPVFNITKKLMQPQF